MLECLPRMSTIELLAKIRNERTENFEDSVMRLSALELDARSYGRLGALERVDGQRFCYLLENFQ